MWWEWPKYPPVILTRKNLLEHLFTHISSWTSDVHGKEKSKFFDGSLLKNTDISNKSNVSLPTNERKCPNIFFTTCQTKFDRKGFAKDVLFFVANWMILCNQFFLKNYLTKCFSIQQKRPLILTYSTYLYNKCTRRLFSFQSVSSITQISEFTIPIWWLIWMLNICLYHPTIKDLFA